MRRVVLVMLVLVAAICAQSWFTWQFQFGFLDTLRHYYTIAVSPYGTDRFDTVTINDTLRYLDTPAGPYLPGMVSFYGYFPVVEFLPGQNKLMKDTRGPASVIQWKFVVSVNDSAYDLYWVPSEVPLSYGSLVMWIGDSMTPSGAVDMSTTDMFDLPGTTVPTTVWIRFTEGGALDTFPPNFVNWYPACGSPDVPTSIESLAVDITDPSDVDQSSISLTVNGISVPSDLLTITPITNGFHIRVSLPANLQPDNDYAILAYACDALGNCGDSTCSFHTAPATPTGVRVWGYVTDSVTGTPITGALVALTSSSDTLFSFTNLAGLYEIVNVPYNTYEVAGYKDGYNLWIDMITLTPPDTAYHLDIHLTPITMTYTVSGHVYDTLMNPLVSASVVATRIMDGTELGSATTNTSGEYSLTGLPGATAIRLVASKTGYLPDTVLLFLNADTLIDFYLCPEHITYRVYGYIYLVGETNHSGTSISLTGTGGPWTDVTDATGSFELTGVPAGSYTFTATHTGFTTITMPVTVVSADVEIIDTMEAESVLMPPRNLTATNGTFASFVMLTWEEPGEAGTEILQHYTGEPAFYFSISAESPLEAFGVTFELPASDYVVDNVEVATYNGVHGVDTPSVIVVLADPDFTVRDTVTTDSYFSSWWMRAEFDEVTVSDSFHVLVRVAPGSPADLELLATNTSGSHDGQYSFYIDSTGAFAGYLADLPGSLGDIGFMIRVTARSLFTGKEITLSPLTVEKPVICRGLARPSGYLGSSRVVQLNNVVPTPAYYTCSVMSPLDVLNYKVYRSTTEFSSPSEATLLATLPATQLSYIDTTADVGVTYYYGVTAVYLEGESPLSNLAQGMRIGYRERKQILILDYDMGDSIACGSAGCGEEQEALRQMLIAIGIPAESIYVSEQNEFFEHFQFYNETPAPNYKAIFWITGVFPQDFFYIPSLDTMLLLNYLYSGGNLYVEGTDFVWAMEDQGLCPSLAQLMGVHYISDGNPRTTGNVQSLTTSDPVFFGGPGASPFSINYAYQQICDDYTDVIEPLSSDAVELMVSQDDSCRMVYYDATMTKSVASSVYLGAMERADYPATPEHILGAILNAFGIPNTSVEEDNLKPISPVTVCITPNPFNASAEIVLSLPLSGHTKVEILDITGKLVRTVYSGEMVSGTHKLVWNGTDNSEKSVSSGVYACRVTTPAGTSIARMTLIK